MLLTENDRHIKMYNTWYSHLSGIQSGRKFPSLATVLPVWSTEDGSMDIKKLKPLDIFLCAKLFGMDENHGSCLLACVSTDNGLVVVHDHSSEWYVACR